MTFPWQKQQWDKLWQAKKADRLSHALLLVGIHGTGKTQFAENFAQALLCQEMVAEDSCHHCHTCRLVTGKSHPNVLWIEPEKDGHTIKIDQIRAVGEFVYQTSLQGEYRIVIINPASQMNANAANALLKMLEEPPSGAIMILITDLSSRLPATILSRCQRIIFPPPPSSQALPWLKEQLQSIGKKEEVDPALVLRFTHGAPLAAIKWVQNGIISTRLKLFQTLPTLSQQEFDPIQIAATLTEIDLLPFLDFILGWILDLLRLQLGANSNEIINIDFSEQLSALKQCTQCQHNMNFLNYLQKLRGQICTGINLNKQLLIESILIKYKALYVPG